MAEVLAIYLITAAAGAAYAGGTLLAVTAFAIQIGFAVGVGYLATSFLTGTQRTRASDRQFISKNPVAARVRSYGRVKVSGVQVFAGIAATKYHRVLVHGEGPIDAVEEHWLDDKQVTIDGSGNATSSNFVSGGSLVTIKLGLGGAAGTHFGLVHAAFPEWDYSHLGQGVFASATIFTQLDPELHARFFPKFDGTIYAPVFRAAKVFDPRNVAHDEADDETWEWSQNAALCVLDYLRHDSGFRVPWSWLSVELQSWKDAADACDEAYDLKAGGTEARFRVSGTYDYTERRADVLESLLAACDGRMLPGPNGGLRLSVPGADVATVTISDNAIINYSVGSGNEAPDTATVLKATYNEPGLGYVETSAEPWVNEALVAVIGEEIVEADLSMVPSHSQARRLMKVAASRLAPEWRGQITTNLRALPVIGERYFNLALAEIDLELVAEIENMEFVIGEGSTVVGLSIAWVSVDPAAEEWDAETEEGTTPTTPDVAQTNFTYIPVLEFTYLVKSSGADTIVEFQWVESFSFALTPYSGSELRLRRTVAGTPDTVLSFGAEVTDYTTPALVPDAAYEVNIRGFIGDVAGPDLAPVPTFTATVNLTAPLAPTGVAILSNLIGGVPLTFTMPASANVGYAYIQREDPATFVPLGAPIGPVYGNAGAVRTRSVSIGLGDNRFSVTAYNASGVAGPSVAVGVVGISDGGGA